MLKGGIGEPAILLWVLGILICCVLGIMRNSGDGQQRTQAGGVVSRSARSSFRAISSYLRIVSSGASTVARSAASVAASIVDRDDSPGHDQVRWAGFDKVEFSRHVVRRVLLLGYRSGFQVWDVEEADNVRDLVSRRDGPVSFMQILPSPMASKCTEDKFADHRPLVVVCSDGSLSGGSGIENGVATYANGNTALNNNMGSGSLAPTAVRFYSLSSQSYVHTLKSRSVVYSVRCSSQVVAISQATQIHCFDATTLEKKYTILTNPIVMSNPGSGGIGYGPLAVGPRWLAYSGSPVAVSNSGRVIPKHLTPSASFPGYSANGSTVAHYAKESSKQLAAGIVTLGDMGYKKLSKYCSELLPDNYVSLQSGSPGWKSNGATNGQMPDTDNVGMVIVRDIVSKFVIAQFRAHKSPISALCFDPCGTLLVTASIQGHNINVFKIMPGSFTVCDSGASYAHLYCLQRGLTNAVIQDISFSDDSKWIMISSSRGTNHLFAINPLGGSVNFEFGDVSFTPRPSGSGISTKPQKANQPTICSSGPPVTLSAVCRIRNGSNGWRDAVTGAAAAATGRIGSLSGAITSTFHNCKGKNNYLSPENCSLKTKYHLLVFSPSGCMIQYELRPATEHDPTTLVSGLSTGCEPSTESDGTLVVEAVQKWSIYHKNMRREREDNIDIYGENGTSDSNKIYPEEIKVSNPLESKEGKTSMNYMEKHHLYISEAELQRHQARMPLWAKPELYFQPMVMKGINVEGDALGELQIERFPTRVLEVKSKDLVPIFDYLQAPKFQEGRLPSGDNNWDGQLLQQVTGLSENDQAPWRGSSGSLDFQTENGTPVAEVNSGIDLSGLGGLMAVENKGFVNNSDSPRAKGCFENVNSREMEAHIKLVNNNSEGLKTENHVDYEGDEFD